MPKENDVYIEAIKLITAARDALDEVLVRAAEKE